MKSKGKTGRKVADSIAVKGGRAPVASRFLKRSRLPGRKKNFSPGTLGGGFPFEIG